MILLNEKSYDLQSIYDAAKHSLSIKSHSFFILYIMPTLSFHYWNLIRKTGELSSQNQIQIMLDDIKNQVKKTIKVNSKALLKSGKPEELITDEINNNKIGWLWLPMDLGKDYTVNIINNLYNQAKLIDKQKLQTVIRYNKQNL